tara:strand:- start:749 stop:1402 length:654 start_codon:yes stop_codon:yes gene_type:complete
MALVRIDTLAGYPVHYDRTTSDAYGKPGTPIRPLIDDRFARECEACFSQLRTAIGRRFGGLKVILTGGVGRAGQGASYHHRYRAFDLDGLVFDETTLIATEFPSRPEFYLTVEALLRLHFGTVLSYTYNQAHRDHFHIDNGSSVKFETMSKSRVQFLQNALFHIFDIPVGRDGVYGPETDGALRIARDELGLGPLSDRDNWRTFLEAIHTRGIERAQ